MSRSALSQDRIARAPGRPRQFDMDDALDKATVVFRKRGYHAASISELSKATKLTESSIYKAFEDKEAVFVAVFDHNCTRRQNDLSSLLATKRRDAGQLRKKR